MPAVLNNVTTENAYGTNTTLASPRGVRIQLDISNASIYYQIGMNVALHRQDPNNIAELLGAESFVPVGDIIYGAEVFTVPKTLILSRICDSIRVRSAVAGKPAQVSISVSKVGELIGAGP